MILRGPTSHPLHVVMKWLLSLLQMLSTKNSFFMMNGAEREGHWTSMKFMQNVHNAVKIVNSLTQCVGYLTKAVAIGHMLMMH